MPPDVSLAKLQLKCNQLGAYLPCKVSRMLKTVASNRSRSRMVSPRSRCLLAAACVALVATSTPGFLLSCHVGDTHAVNVYGSSDPFYAWRHTSDNRACCRYECRQNQFEAYINTAVTVQFNAFQLISCSGWLSLKCGYDRKIKNIRVRFDIKRHIAER